MPLPRIVLDALSPLSHKELIGEPGSTKHVGVLPTWVPDDDLRRLNGYTTLEAYWRNTGRLTLPADTKPADRKAWREYGDVSAFLDRLVAAILGDDWTITVDGADEDLTDGPDLAPKPTDPPSDADPIAKRVAQVLADAWQADAEATVDAWEAALVAQPGLVERQSEIRAWAERAQLAAHLDEGEHKAVGLGDAVYVLWPRDGDWPSIEVYHPGFYFAELGDDDRGEFPRAIHFGWEFDERDPAGVVHRRVRRMTFELVPIVEARFDPFVGVFVDLDGIPLPDDAPFPLLSGAVSDVRIGDEIRRRYPWTPANPADDDLSQLTCLFSNGTWDLADVHDRKVDALDDARARWDALRQDLRIDFLPVIHEPNTPTGSEHYGVAAITAVAQLIDDMAQIDTRIMTASEFLGLPTATVAGAKVPEVVRLTPGTLLGLGENGRMDMLDLSASVERLFELADRLADRFLANLGAPREVMGRIDDTTASGIHLLIKYLPWAQVIGALRLPREPKMQLFLKFAQRMAQVQGALPEGETPVCRLRYGNFLPMNRSEVIENVTKAVEGRVMSRLTGLRLLIAAGVPVDDAQAELDAIRADDAEAAKAVADATGSEQLAAERLGLELPQPAAGAPPTVTLP